MRRIGVPAAALALVLAATGCGGSERAAGHSCDPHDRRFLETAKTNMVAFSLWSDGYRRGEIDAGEVVAEAQNASKRVSRMRPRDASLRRAQRYIDLMFAEYGEAVSLHAGGESAGERMDRAYGLAAFARDVLLEAQPELERRGCDVGPLL